MCIADAITNHSKERRRNPGTQILDANPEGPDANQRERNEERKNSSIIASKREVPQSLDDRRGFRLDPSEDLLDAVAGGATTHMDGRDNPGSQKPAR